MKFDDKIPIYLQIQNYLNHQIITGDIQPGEKLPSIRQLAVTVTANVNTVQRAVTEMVNENIIEPQRGKGNFVTTDTELIKNLKDQLVLQQIEFAYDELHSLKLSDHEILIEFEKFIAKRSATNE